MRYGGCGCFCGRFGERVVGLSALLFFFLQLVGWLVDGWMDEWMKYLSMFVYLIASFFSPIRYPGARCVS